MSSLGYKEITLKSDTEPAIIAFRNRVAENCKAEVTSEDAVKRDKPSNGLVENAVMLLRGVIRTIHKKNSEMTPRFCRGWWNTREGRDGRTPFERLHGKKPTQRVCAVQGEGAGKTDILRTVEQNESWIQVWSVAGSEKQQCRVFRALEVRRMEHQNRWDKEAINNVIGGLVGLADGKWTRQ